MTNLKELQRAAYAQAKVSGFHPNVGDASFGERIALVHSELSEALEEYRHHHPLPEVRIEDGKPEGVPIELADVIIRIADLAETHGIDLTSAIDLKMKYNALRPYRHGSRAL